MFLCIWRRVYKFTCGRCNATYYGKTCHHCKVRVGEHSGISTLTNKRSNSKKSTTVKDHMVMCDQPVSFDDFKVLASSNSKFHLKIKESLLISRDQFILNKNEASLPLYLFDLLHKYFTALYDYFVSSSIYCYLHYVVFGTKIYAPVSFKIVLKIVEKKFS